MNLLTLTIILPLAGVLALAVTPRENTKAIKVIALLTSVITLISSLLILTKYKFGVSGFQLVASHSWFKVFDINYAVGIDGVANFKSAAIPVPLGNKSIPVLPAGILMTFVGEILGNNAFGSARVVPSTRLDSRCVSVISIFFNVDS